jgi:hypothetical protein
MLEGDNLLGEIVRLWPQNMEMVLRISVNIGLDCMDNKLTIQPYFESYS